MADNITEHVVKLRDDASGWRKVDGPRLDPDDPFLTGLDEQEAENLVRANWALQRSSVEEAQAFYGSETTEPPFNPGEKTVDELEAELEDGDYGSSELTELAAAEEEGKNRETAIEAIEAHIQSDEEE